jgi:Zn-dependent protease with chaperone function
MRFVSSKYLNFSLSTLYTLISILLFIVLQIVAFATPCLSGLLILFFIKQLYLLIGSTSGSYPSIYAIVFGGFIASFMTFFNFLKGIKYAISTPEEDNIAEDPRILSLINNVSRDVGISSFHAVYLSSELDISTFYIGRRRYLNLSAVSLKYLTEEELKAVIAHECAHHHNNAMLLNRTHNRSVIMFESFVNSLLGTHSTFEKNSQKNILIAYIFNMGAWTLLSFIPFIYLYRYFLALMGFLIRNAEYEYYCDSVAAKYIGGNILASALQKILDLHLAYNEAIKLIDKDNQIVSSSSVEKIYLEGLSQKFHYIRYFNPKYRAESANISTDTHPPLRLRISRAQSISCKVDRSQPLLSETEVTLLLSRLPDSSLTEKIKRVIQDKQRLKAISQAKETVGKASIVFHRKRSFSGSLMKYQIFINNEYVGKVKNGETKQFLVDPGSNIVYFKVGRFGGKSEVVELILLAKDSVDIDSWSTSTSVHIKLRDECDRQSCRMR